MCATLCTKCSQCNVSPGSYVQLMAMLVESINTFKLNALYLNGHPKQSLITGMDSFIPGITDQIALRLLCENTKPAEVC